MKIELDKYYTPQNIVEVCVNRVKSAVLDVDDIIEPSAGGGAFINALKENYDCEMSFYDIKPEHDDIKEQDFYP